MKLVPQVEPDTSAPEPTVDLVVTIRDAETMLAIRAIVASKMQDEPYWGEVVLELLTSYADRSKHLTDWWVWTRFLATFGTVRHKRGNQDEVYNTWLASDRLDALVQCHQALMLYRTWPLWKRIWKRSLYRKACADFDVMVLIIANNDASWCDRNDFLRYKASVHG